MHVVIFYFFVKWVRGKALKCMIPNIRVKATFVKENILAYSFLFSM